LFDFEGDVFEGEKLFLAIRKPGRYILLSCARMAQRKPSMTPTMGLRE